MPTLTRHFKRFRMERALTAPVEKLLLPKGFFLVPWEDRLVDIHGDVKYRCFVDELDGAIFPNLTSVTGCRLLMRAIRDCPGFCAPATWLVASAEGYCGTIQGIIQDRGVGVIQNLGVTAGCRGLGLGAVLLARSIAGFAEAGAKSVVLDVTALNTPAVRLYRKFGFRATRATYLPVV